MFGDGRSCIMKITLYGLVFDRVFPVPQVDARVEEKNVTNPYKLQYLSGGEMQRMWHKMQEMGQDERRQVDNVTFCRNLWLARNSYKGYKSVDYFRRWPFQDKHYRA
ncbi:Hypothetical predicted protein [Mytilus galloprovincialis]|uniref:Uncharacterized protein n=1 Tax=Mytilus galloprovincialis TaxID=29158 RepID=A0A8B6BUY5_MYTGA|nr:Hypothetical predicted protein [Mytilus galloprovincialis]